MVDPNAPLQKSMIGVCGGIRPEWAYTDFACALFGLTSVPVHTKAGTHISTTSSVCSLSLA